MIIACPHCGSADVAKYGWRELRPLTIEQGRLVEGRERRQRYQCKMCEKAFFPASIDGMVQVEEHVVDLALRKGTLAASEELGCGIQMVRSILRGWSEPREDVVPTIVPSTLAVRVVEISGHEHLVLADLQNDALVDLLPRRDDLEPWLDAREGRPDLAVIAVDSKLAMSLRAACPDVDIAIPISEAQAAVLASAERTLRSLTRDAVAVGRNFRERPELLVRSDADLGDDERIEMSMWSQPAAALRRCVLGLLEAFAGTEKEFRRTLASCREALGRILPNSVLANFLANWGQEIAVGVRERWTDVVHRRLAELVEGTRAARPRSSFAVVRGVLVLSGEIAPALEYAVPGRARRPAGRSFDEVEDALRTYWCEG